MVIYSCIHGEQFLWACVTELRDNRIDSTHWCDLKNTSLAILIAIHKSVLPTRSPKLRRSIIKYTYHKYFSNIYSSIKTHNNKKLNKRKLINFNHWHWKRKIKKERNWEFFLSFSDKSSRKWIHIAHSIRNTKKGLYFWHTQ